MDFSRGYPILSSYEHKIGILSSIHDELAIGPPRPHPLHTASTDSVEWRHMQSFGDDGTSDDDLVTALAYDPTGNYVAVGDKAGRVCLFEAVGANGTYRDSLNQCLAADLTVAHPNKLLTRARRTQLGDSVPPPHDEEDTPLPDRHIIRPLAALAKYPVGSRYPPQQHMECRRVQADQAMARLAASQSNSPDAHGSHESGYTDSRISRTHRNRFQHTFHSDGNPEKTENSDKNEKNVEERMNTLPRALEYRFYTEYQAHESEFDALKSTDIEPRVTSLCWAGSTPSSQHLLSANDKSIKLWKLHDKEIRVSNGSGSDVSSNSVPNISANTHGDFIFPSSTVLHVVPSTQCRNVYRGAHSYHVNSVSACADQSTFVTSDDLVVNMWNYEHPGQSFNLVNIKPIQLEEITEVITRVVAHPQHSALVSMATSRGCICLLDTRARASCDTYVRSFERAEDPLHKTFFTEVVHCASDVKFVPDGRHIVSRDYFNVYVWDIAMENQPVATIPVHDYLRGHMCDLYENDCLFDQFRVDISPDGQRIATGSYHNHFIIHNLRTGTTETLEAGARNLKKKDGGGVTASGAAPENPNIAFMDFSRRAQHIAWHPQLDVLAVAGVNKLYIYQAHEADNGL